MTTCLVIEDSDDVRRIMCRLLAESGVSILDAEGPALGIQLCREKRPEIVFLDWDLPGLGALDFLRVLPTFSPRPVIVVCMTYNDPREKALAKAAGVSYLLMKPYNRDELDGILRDVCKTAISSAEADPKSDRSG